MKILHIKSKYYVQLHCSPIFARDCNELDHPVQCQVGRVHEGLLAGGALHRLLLSLAAQAVHVTFPAVVTIAEAVHVTFPAVVTIAEEYT